MQGSLYPNGVLVDRTALRRTEVSKASQILRMRTDLTSRGIYTGGAITINAVNTDRIDIAAFSGYTPRGDYIEETGSNANVALADYALSTVNVVCAVYTENSIHNQPHESDGSTYPTEAEGSYRIRVFSQANFDNPAVLSTSDNNLQNDAKDRCLILCKVTAQGVGGALNLATDVQLPTDYNNILYTSPQDLIAITGVTILSVDPNTPTGTGTITFDDTGAPPYSFKYTSPGGVISGAVTTSADDVLTITDGSGYWIKLQVLVSQLPLGLVVPYAETFSIINLYYQEVPSLTAEDHLHRNYLGTGIITTNNPHGQSLDDFAGTTLSLLDEHQDVQHCNGIWRGSASGIFEGSVNTGTALGDTLNITSPVATDLFYVNGTKQNAINLNQILFSPANVTGTLGAGSHLGAKLFEFYVDDNETLVSNLRLEVAHPRNCSGIWIVDISPDHPVGNFNLRMVITAGPTTVSLQWGDTDSYEEIVSAPAVSGITGQILRVYHPDNVNWVDVFIGDDAGATDLYLPVPGTYTDVVTVSAALNREENMQFMSVPYWYDIAAIRGTIGYPFTGGTRTITDNRLWGNLCITNMADAALNHMSYYPTFEYNRSGLLNRRHLGYRTDWQIANLSAPSLQIRQSGGVCYVRGQRLEAEGEDVTLNDNKTTIIWVDYEGDLHYDDFSIAPFTSSYTQAIEWLVGYPQDRDVVKYPSYVGNSEVTPQRGLPLYVVTTLAGAVTNTVDLTRFVGAHVEEWSVGAATNHAQFASLESAFAYAAHETQASVSNTQTITIKLVGASTITTTVTQPRNVIVEGSWDNGTLVTVSPSAPDNNGSWRLSTGSIVKDVWITCTVAGPAFGLANYATLDHIYFTSTTGMFSSLNQSANDVTISNCNIVAEVGMFYVPAVLGPSFSRMKIVDNNIYSTNSQGNSLVRLDNALNCEIARNYIYKDNSNTNIDACLEVSSSDEAWINGNLIRIGQGDGSAIERGIYVIDSSYVKITENIVTVESGSTSVAGLGIHAEDCISVLIEGNVINSMAQGILVGGALFAAYYFEDAVIRDNHLTGCYTFGISAFAGTDGSVANTIKGLRIEDNTIYAMSKPAPADALFGDYQAGIYLAIIDGTLTDIKDLVIRNNVIDGVVNANAAGSTYGINAAVWGDFTSSVTSRLDNLKVDDNVIAGLEGTTTNEIVGIAFYSILGDYPTDPLALGYHHNMSFSRNSIYMFSPWSLASTTFVQGIRLYASTGTLDNKLVSLINIDGNDIYIATASPYTDVGDGILLLNSPDYSFTRTSISNNTIDVPWYGIRAGLDDESIISDNIINAGSVGVDASEIVNSSVENNIVNVKGNNDNKYVSIDGVNYGQLGISSDTKLFNGSIRGNKVTLYNEEAGYTIGRGSVSYYIAGDSTFFDLTENISFHYYADLSGAAGVDQAFNIYVADADFCWSISRNLIYNDGSYQTLNLPNHTHSKSHGMFLEWPSGAANSEFFRGVINYNITYGSISTLDAPLYELAIGSWGVLTYGAVMYMSNYIGLSPDTAAAGGTTNIRSSYPVGAMGLQTNGVNMWEKYTGGVWSTFTW